MGKVDPTGLAWVYVKGFFRATQRGDNLCWAAAGVSIARTLGKKTTERAFAKLAHLRSWDVKGFPWDVAIGLKRLGLKGRWEPGWLSLSALAKKMRRDEPVVVHWTGQRRHAVVVYGVNESEQRVRVWDVARGGGDQEMKYSTLKHSKGKGRMPAWFWWGSSWGER